jgi:hypothetical protein
MKLIRLATGEYSMVDDDDYEYLSLLKWHVNKGKYTNYARCCFGPRNFPVNILMHRLILNVLILQTDLQIDHIDGDGLNNQRSNLRIVTRRVNQLNRRFPSTSKYPGVYWNKKDKIWQVQIRVDGKQTYLGASKSEENAYDIYQDFLQGGVRNYIGGWV